MPSKCYSHSESLVFTVASVGETLGGIPIAYINRTHTAGTSDAKTTDGTDVTAANSSTVVFGATATGAGTLIDAAWVKK